MEKQPGMNIEKIKRKRRKKHNSRENKSAPLKKKLCRAIWIQFSSFFTCLLTYSSIEMMYFMANILLLVFFYKL